MASADPFLRNGRNDLARKYLRLALGEDPDSGRAHALLARTLATGSTSDDAVREGREAVRLAPQDPLSHAALGEALDANRRSRESIESFREALRLAPRNPYYQARLARSLRMNGSFKEALAAAEAGLAINPIASSCLNERGLALLAMRRLDEARESIRSALVSAPESSTLHNNLGLGLLHEGQNREAREEFLEALRLDPEDEAAAQNLKIAKGRGSASAARLMRASSWWLFQPTRVRLLTIVVFAVLAATLWAGFAEPALILGAVWLTSAVTKRARGPKGLMRTLSRRLDPIRGQFALFAAYGPMVLGITLGRYEWGMGLGMTLIVLLAIAVSEPNGVFHWLALAIAAGVAVIGVFRLFLTLPLEYTVWFGLSWVLLYLPDLVPRPKYKPMTGLSN